MILTLLVNNDINNNFNTTINDKSNDNNFATIGILWQAFTQAVLLMFVF